VSPRSRSEWRPARAFRKIRAYSTRRTSTATGVVLVLATIAALGAAALDPTLTGTGYLTAIANHPNRLAVSALLYLAAAGTSVGIAIALYPLCSTTDNTTSANPGLPSPTLRGNQRKRKPVKWSGGMLAVSGLRVRAVFSQVKPV
jgi:hypothetical protein